MSALNNVSNTPNEADMVLIVGSGNIAKRHVAIVKELFPAVTIMLLPTRGISNAEHASELKSSFTDVDIFLSSILDAPAQIWLSIIASPAPLHQLHFDDLVLKSQQILIEKPLADTSHAARRIMDMAELHKIPVMLGYCLRYLSSTHIVKRLLTENALGPLVMVKSSVGQYLPHWRPGDYTLSVSARKELGGGALLELSHEFDLINYLFGECQVVNAIVAQSKTLNIDVEDIVQANLMTTDHTLVSVSLDFLQHNATRTVTIVGKQATLNWDLIANRIDVTNAQGNVQTIPSPQDWQSVNMYKAQLTEFIDAPTDFRGATPLSGWQVIKVIDEIKRIAVGV